MARRVTRPAFRVSADPAYCLSRLHDGSHQEGGQAHQEAPTDPRGPNRLSRSCDRPRGAGSRAATHEEAPSQDGRSRCVTRAPVGSASAEVRVLLDTPGCSRKQRRPERHGCGPEADGADRRLCSRPKRRRSFLSPSAERAARGGHLSDPVPRCPVGDGLDQARHCRFQAASRQSDRLGPPDQLCGHQGAPARTRRRPRARARAAQRWNRSLHDRGCLSPRVAAGEHHRCSR
jgi:hypothetical protein